MKRYLTFLIVLCASCLTAKAQTNTAIAPDTLLNNCTNNHVDYLREPRYKLYSTQNEWLFLKLDTMTGQIWQVQVAPEKSKRIEYVLDDTVKISSSDEQLCGRFTLYETTQLYRLILLDTVDGRCWWVQWNYNKELRSVVRIPLANV